MNHPDRLTPNQQILANKGVVAGIVDLYAEGGGDLDFPRIELALGPYPGQEHQFSLLKIAAQILGIGPMTQEEYEIKK